jgi:hypothetical protein
MGTILEAATSARAGCASRHSDASPLLPHSPAQAVLPGVTEVTGFDYSGDVLTSCTAPFQQSTPS